MHIRVEAGFAVYDVTSQSARNGSRKGREIHLLLLRGRSDGGCRDDVLLCSSKCYCQGDRDRGAERRRRYCGPWLLFGAWMRVLMRTSTIPRRLLHGRVLDCRIVRVLMRTSAIPRRILHGRVLDCRILHWK
jgi:hypothetical protein